MSNQFDLLIIGGGINGCAVAWTAARLGYDVALVEKNDFGCGVTSRSTRLIHGGLRYLESFQFRLVRESLHDRDVWLDEFPGLVKPLEFLVPVYKTDSRPAWYINIGLHMYSWMTPNRDLRAHRKLSAKQVKSWEPGVDQEGLRAGLVYFDGQCPFPERVSLEMALDAERRGALVRNHAAVEEFLVEKGAVVGARLSDGEELRAKLTINAAGAWIDDVRGLLPKQEPNPLLTLLNGAHIFVKPFPGSPSHAIYHEARADQRPFFIVPWRGLCMIGTTETKYDGDPGDVAPLDSEIEYLLREVNWMLPEANLREDDIVFSYAGPRPLLRSSGNMNSASRDHQTYDHGKEEGLPGLLTMVGGKLTTAPAFGYYVVEQAGEILDKKAPARPSAERPEASALGQRSAREREVFGLAALDIERLAAEQPSAAEPFIDGAPYQAAEVLHAVRAEKAQTIADVLLRRTGLGYEAGFCAEWVDATGRLLATELQWDRAQQESQLEAFWREYRRTLHSRVAPTPVASSA